MKFNAQGAYWLYVRETTRVLHTKTQTIFGPIFTNFLYSMILCILSTGSFNLKSEIYKFTYIGLIFSTIVNGAFANSSSSIAQAKFNGYITDIMYPPLNSAEVILAHIFAALTRTLIVAFLLFLCCNGIAIYNIPKLILYFVLTANISCLLGILSSILCNSIEQISSITNYIIFPLSLFSGNFFSINLIPEKIRFIMLINPFFYLVDGFRSAFGHQMESNTKCGIILSITLIILLSLLIRNLINNAWKLRD